MTASPLRLAFAGTPDFAVPALEALIASQHELVLVYTQPDKTAGRGRHISHSPVKTCALRHQLPISQPDKFNQPAVLAEFEALQCDAMIVIAYGHILSKRALAIPKLGCLNVHASLLPRWRGAAPIQSAVMAGDSESGIAIMQMEAGLDTGPVFFSASCSIDDNDTGGRLHDKLAALSAEHLVVTIDAIAEGTLTAQAQDGSLATYAPKISKTDACIDWSLSAKDIANQVRAYNPWPVCYSELDGQTIRIWQADAVDAVTAAAKPGTIVQADKQHCLVATGKGCLQLLSCQLPNKPKRDWQALRNGYERLFAPGTRFNG